MPVPYSSRTIKSMSGSSTCLNIWFTSSRPKTVGSRTGPFAYVNSESQGSSRPSTSLYRNNNADNACVCVEAATLRSTASDVRNTSPPLAQLRRVALAVKMDVSFHPLRVRTLGTQAVVPQPDTIPKLIEQPGRPGRGRVGRRSVHVQAQLIGQGERYES